MLTSIVEQMLETFGEQFAQRGAGQGIIPAMELFEHVQQNYQYFQAMLRGHSGEILWEAAQTTLSKTIEQTLIATYADKAPPAISWTLISNIWPDLFSLC